MTVATLVFFSTQRRPVLVCVPVYRRPDPRPAPSAWLLPGVFYVWVNCFGVIAPVQAWSFANSLFDTRQARRLFGLIGAGASLGAIAAGLLARFLVGPVGGTVNMMLVLAALILLAAAIVIVATHGFRGAARRRAAAGRRGIPSSTACGRSRASPYLRLMAALVFLVADRDAVDRVSAEPRGRSAFRRRRGCADRVLRHLQLRPGRDQLPAAAAVRRSGAAALRRGGHDSRPAVVARASAACSSCSSPESGPCCSRTGSTRALRFSLDKATYELLYLPLPPALRAPIKNTIDIVVSRFADAAGAVLLGVATQGFFGLGGLGAGLRGTAAINLGFIGVWCAVAWRLRVEYVRTIRQTIRRHRIDTERMPPGALDRSATAALGAALGALDVSEVRYALDLLEAQRIDESLLPVSGKLLTHGEPDIRRRALLILAAAKDRTIGRRRRRDAARPGSVRAAPRRSSTSPARWASTRSRSSSSSATSRAPRSGPRRRHSSRPRAVAESRGGPGDPRSDGARPAVRRACRTGSRPRACSRWRPMCSPICWSRLIADEDPQVALQAISAASAATRDDLIEPLMAALARPELTDEAARALALYRNAIVPELERRLHDDDTPVEIRRELPAVLVRIGTPLAQQVLIEGLLQADVTLRYRIVASLNKLQDVHPDLRVDREVVELLHRGGDCRPLPVVPGAGAAAGTAQGGRSRSAGAAPLDGAGARADLQADGAAVPRIRAARCLRGPAVHQLGRARQRARVPRQRARAGSAAGARAAARQPGHASRSGSRLRTGWSARRSRPRKQAVATLLASEDAWLRSCAVYAVGALQLHGLAGEAAPVQGRRRIPVLRKGVAGCAGAARG